MTTRVAPELPLALVWPSSGGETAWQYVAGRPATILMSPGQARQTIRAYHLVVHRPREGHMLAIGQHVEEAEHLLPAESFTVQLCI